MSKQQLIFVYNVGSDLFSTVTDFAHKILSPSTYQCHLCELTYGNFAMKQEWKEFIDTLPVKTIFLHKDDFLKQYKIDSGFPAVFIDENGTIKSFLTEEKIEQCKTLQQLKKIISSKLSTHDQHYHSDI